MAALPPITAIKKEDFPKESWSEKLLWPLNRFMNSVYAALNKNLTFTENIRSQVKELNFIYSTDILPIKFAWTLANRPTDLWVSSVTPQGSAADPTAAVWAQWTFDGSAVVVTKIFGLTADDRYTVRFIIASN